MDKRDRATLFRSRLDEILTTSTLSRSALAERAGLDRSAVSQMLKPDATVLPNGHSVAALAESLNVSSDWLLGLADDPRPSSQVLESAVMTTAATRHPIDQNILNWHEEALGQKIRYVPSTLPTPMKTNAVLRYEFDTYGEKTPDQAISDAEERLSFFRRPESELEIAVSTQSLRNFAIRADIWDGLDHSERVRQIEEMAVYCRDLYPGIRLHLFCAKQHYSAPIMVFGHERATIYLGNRYFVFPKGERVRTLIRHFDELVRGAVVTSDKAADWLDELANEMKKEGVKR